MTASPPAGSAPGPSGPRGDASRGEPRALVDHRLPRRSDIPARATGTTRPISGYQIEGDIRSTLQRLGFPVVAHLGQGAGLRHRHQPPFVEGLVIGERAVRADVHRTRGRIVGAVVGLVGAFAIAIGGLALHAFTGTLGGLWILVFVVLLLVGIVLLPATTAFRSQVIFVDYRARRLPRSGGGPPDPAAAVPYDIAVGAGGMISVNWNDEYGHKGRRVIRMDPDSPSLAALPSEVVRALIGPGPTSPEPSQGSKTSNRSSDGKPT